MVFRSALSGNEGGISCDPDTLFGMSVDIISLIKKHPTGANCPPHFESLQLI